MCLEPLRFSAVFEAYEHRDIMCLPPFRPARRNKVNASVPIPYLPYLPYLLHPGKSIKADGRVSFSLPFVQFLTGRSHQSMAGQEGWG